MKKIFNKKEFMKRLKFYGRVSLSFQPLIALFCFRGLYDTPKFFAMAFLTLAVYLWVIFLLVNRRHFE